MSALSCSQSLDKFDYFYHEILHAHFVLHADPSGNVEIRGTIKFFVKKNKRIMSLVYVTSFLPSEIEHSRKNNISLCFDKEEQQHPVLANVIQASFSLASSKGWKKISISSLMQ